ncbi:MAG: class I SAM-dependent methyltransferase [Thermoleophilia bacterium]|nr:class I SAM-dependent methyltransferase [Thermoleophilia bacterium]
MSTEHDSEPPPTIDVDRLVDDLRARAAHLRAGGAYGPEVGTGPVPIASGRPQVVFRPQLGYSSKPGIGKVITGVKQVQLRLLFHVLNDIAQQTDSAVGDMWPKVAEAHDRALQFAAGLEAEAAERVRAQRDISALSQRIDAFERRVEELQLGPRLARLERAPRAAAAPSSAPSGDALGTPAAPPAPPAGGLRIDYESFEGRYRPEEAVRRHQERYLEYLGDRGRVLDVGCGRGELVEMLRERGVDATGVDLDPDFAGLAASRGLPVVHGDGIAHVNGLPAGSLDGIMASHVVEHLEAAELLRLIHGAADALAPGGVLIMETPNPESLVAGSVNFHRDLTHRRPIHPDTLAFLCESAGFTGVEILRLSPVPDDERLPVPSGDGPDAEVLRRIVGKLNDLVYGFQDYAVVAHVPS